MRLPPSSFSTTAANVTAALLFVILFPISANAQAPTKEVAVKCQKLSYEAFPHKRVGSVKASPDRGLFFRDCMAKNGKVDLPEKK